MLRTATATTRFNGAGAHAAGRPLSPHCRRACCARAACGHTLAAAPAKRSLRTRRRYYRRASPLRRPGLADFRRLAQAAVGRARARTGGNSPREHRSQRRAESRGHRGDDADGPVRSLAPARCHRERQDRGLFCRRRARHRRGPAGASARAGNQPDAATRAAHRQRAAGRQLGRGPQRTFICSAAFPLARCSAG